MSTPERLGGFEMFDHFSEKHLADLASCASMVRFPAGVTVLKEGDSANDCYIVDEGTVRIKRETPYGPFTVALLGAGDLFGETNYVHRDERSMDVVTDEDTSLFLFNPMAISNLTEKDSRFELSLYWAFWKSLSKKLRTTNVRLTKFFSEGGGPKPQTPPAEDHDADGFHLDMDAKQDIFAEQKLSTMEINFLASLSKELQLRSGEVLFREGDPGDTMYIVLDGKVRISKNIPGAGEEALAIIERGDYFGEMALIDNQHRSAEAKAHSAGTVVLAIPKDVVDGLLSMHKVSSMRLLKILCTMIAHRLRELDDKLVGWFILAGGQIEDPL